MGFLGFLSQKATDIVKDLKADVTAKETELQKANKVIFPFNLLSSITENHMSYKINIEPLILGTWFAVLL